jgi:hypothetical protein
VELPCLPNEHFDEYVVAVMLTKSPEGIAMGDADLIGDSVKVKNI